MSELLVGLVGQAAGTIPCPGGAAGWWDTLLEECPTTQHGHRQNPPRRNSGESHQEMAQNTVLIPYAVGRVDVQIPRRPEPMTCAPGDALGRAIDADDDLVSAFHAAKVREHDAAETCQHPGEQRTGTPTVEAAETRRTA